MKVTLTASTGIQILVWREGDLFAARHADAVNESQTCLGVDLFEVLAELTGLNLDDRAQAAEAVALAGVAQRRLAPAAAATRGAADGEGAQLDASDRG
jgi:hypothetical protein